MSAIGRSERTMGMGETHASAFGASVTATPIPNVRFWIISMMLVLFGLSTLKLR